MHWESNTSIQMGPFRAPVNQESLPTSECSRLQLEFLECSVLLSQKRHFFCSSTHTFKPRCALIHSEAMPSNLVVYTPNICKVICNLRNLRKLNYISTMDLFVQALSTSNLLSQSHQPPNEYFVALSRTPIDFSWELPSILPLKWLRSTTQSFRLHLLIS